MRVQATVVDAGTARSGLSRALARIVGDRLDLIGKDMVQLAEAKMAARYNLNRPYERRRHPGSRRAAGALDYRKDGDTVEQTVAFRVNGGEQVRLRILGLNYGTPAHTIAPSGAWELKGLNPRNINRARRRGAPDDAGNFTGIAFPFGNNPAGYFITEGSVQHPGTAAGGFLQEARDEAVARNL